VRVLTAQWGSANRVSPAKSDAVVTGEDSEKKAGEAASPTLMAKPMFVYVTDGGTEGAYDKIEKVVLDNNKVLIGMKAFKCVKMSPSDVNDDPLLSGRSKDDRYFLFVSRDYKKITVVDSKKMKAKTVFGAMKKHAKRDYSTKFEPNVKATLKLILDFDKINNGIKVLKAKKDRLGSDISKGESKKINKELAELEEAQKSA
jgi:hypothetical protein